jgi:hypothetical protein
LRVLVRLDAPDPEVNRAVRVLLPNAVSVDVVLPTQPVAAAGPPPATDGTPTELYAAYHLAVHGTAPPPGLMERFAALLAGIEGTR